MSEISFKTTYKPNETSKIGSGAVLALPKNESMKLPSRGTVMVEGTINGVRFRAPLEPDGQASHWFQIDESAQKTIGIVEGDTISLEIKPTKLWPEPRIPTDLKKLLESDAETKAKWEDITPMARWEWIRWMDAVVRAETRKERPAKLASMLKSGKRRPCCFNRALRTLPKTATIL